MIKIIDTYGEIASLFDKNVFNSTKWEVYMNSIYPDSANIFKNEVNAYLASGKYTFERDFLPILNAVSNNPNLDVLHRSFLTATNDIDQKIVRKFGQGLDADIVLYLGLCNAAERVTSINGRKTILLGTEKILELGWQGLNSMYSLIYHELGHIYHAQYGYLEQHSEDSKVNFVWQLFEEGIAMYFEQMLLGDLNFFHQGIEWAQWCSSHFTQILMDFDNNLPTITRFNQRYFGDWADYYGHGDVGYFLGTKFVHWLLKTHGFEELICLDIGRVYHLYHNFIEQISI